jgi:glyoxylase I family protein
MSHLRVGAALIDLLIAEGPAGRNMDHFCLRVDPFDQQAIVAHLKKHGVAVGEIRRRYGAEGNGISIYLSDPEGNTVELKGPSDGKPPPE